MKKVNQYLFFKFFKNTLIIKAVEFNDKRPNKDSPYCFPIPYRISRGIATYLDKLTPMDFLVLKIAAIISYTGGCLSGTFELGLLATIFPKVLFLNYRKILMKIIHIYL